MDTERKYPSVSFSVEQDQSTAGAMRRDLVGGVYIGAPDSETIASYLRGDKHGPYRVARGMKYFE